MTKQERRASQKKQERLQIKKGTPLASDLKEGVPEVRYVSGTGLVEYTRFKGVLYKKELDKA